MTVEEQKAALDKVSLEINQKLDAATAGIQKGEKASATLKDELNVLLEKHSNLSDKQGVELAKANERIDGFETQLQKMGDRSMPDSFGSLMEKAFTESFEAKGRIQGTFQLDGLDTKAIMLQSTNLVNDVIQPDRVAGVVSPLEREAHIRPYIAPGNTTSSSVDYIEETAYTDGMDSVAEGAALTQSDLTLTQQTSVVKKVGSYATISREMLEDVAGLMSYVQGRLLAKYWQREDTELLFGDGIGTNLLGVGTNAVAWADPGVVDANATEWDVFRAAVLQGQVAEYMPNLIICHPDQLYGMDVSKDANGAYHMPYIFSGQSHQVSGVPIIASTAIATDNFLVGDFARGAQIFDRRNITLEVASEHSDDWVKDLMSVKLTTRLALPIYRQEVFIGGVMSTSLAALKI